jgi:hypothetical protein
VDRIAVAVAGVAALAVALWLIIRFRDTRRLTAAPPDGASRGERLAFAAARVAGSVAGAATAGVLVLGLGGRLMMRLLAATSPESVQGGLTEAEEIVGRVTLSGTIGFVLFTGIFGGLAGVGVYALLRRGLPDRSLTAGLMTGAIMAGPFARMSGLLDPDNPDFVILEPTWLAVAVISALLVTFALLAAVLIDRWAAIWPRPGRSSRRGMAGLLPLLPTMLTGPGALMVLATIGFGARVRPIEGRSRLSPYDRPVRVGVGVLAAAGAAFLVVTVLQTLSV